MANQVLDHLGKEEDLVNHKISKKQLLISKTVTGSGMFMSNSTDSTGLDRVGMKKGGPETFCRPNRSVSRKMQHFSNLFEISFAVCTCRPVGAEETSGG